MMLHLKSGSRPLQPEPVIPLEATTKVRSGKDFLFRSALADKRPAKLKQQGAAIGKKAMR